MEPSSAADDRDRRWRRSPRSRCASISAKTCRKPTSASALKTGDMGFLHSFTTGSAVDGPGIRLVAWTTACMFRCQILPQPRHLDADERHPGDARAGDRGGAQIRQRPEGDARRLHAVGRRAADAGPLRRAAVRGGQGHGRSHRHRNQRLFTASGCRTRSLRNIDLVILDMKAFTPEQHKRVTGMPTMRTCWSSARRLAALKRPMWLRYVLVPGLTDIPEEMAGGRASSARRLASSSEPRSCRSTRWAGTSGSGWGSTISSAETEPPSNEGVEAAVSIFRSAGLQAN